MDNPYLRWCFNISNQELSGTNFKYSNYKLIAAELFICLNTSHFICSNTTLMKEAIMVFDLKMYIKSKYADLNDINTPIKEYTEMIHSAKLHPEIKVRETVLIEKHELTLEDSAFYTFSQPEPKVFNKV